ncbi:MAG: sigma-70 family RNA polymerase sigma factor [bacterium]|nr:sigma-70 family RNA polymerase sigma factor [bacterium]
MESDFELIRGVRQRDPGAFEIFVRRYQHRIYFTALRMLGDRDEALDAAQEVFLKLWRFAPRLRPDVHLERWAYRVAVNACIDRLRSLRRVDTVNDSDNLILLSRVDKGSTPAEHAQQAEELNELKRAMNDLTEKQRAVFVLRHFQNLKLQEIAEVMSMPLGTVKATLHQTLNKLRVLLEGTVIQNDSLRQAGPAGER